jgi:hypothetical protein
MKSEAVKKGMVVAILCVATVLYAQVTNGPVPLPTTSTATSSSVMVWEPQATATDKITKHGHYVFTVDDPNNEWRCQVVSVDTQRWAASAFTIVCVKPHTVTDEREKGGSR